MTKQGWPSENKTWQPMTAPEMQKLLKDSRKSTRDFLSKEIRKGGNRMIRQPIRVTKEEALKIIRSSSECSSSYNRLRGLFWLEEDDGKYVAIDNSTGDAWTEEFTTLEDCLSYLLRNDEEETT